MSFDNQWQPLDKIFGKVSDKNKERLKRLIGLLLLLLIVLLLLFACGSLALIGMNKIPNQDTRSGIKADYNPWETGSFEALDPAIIDEIEKDLLKEKGDLNPIYYGYLPWWLPEDITVEELAAILIKLTNIPDETAQITPTPSPVLTATGTQPQPLIPTSSPTATASATPTIFYIPPANTSTNIPPPPNTPVPTATPLPGGIISGTIFEDVNYAGGAGGAIDGGDQGLANVTAELYTSGSIFISSTTTDASGNYSFTVAADGNYYIRVVSSTIGDADTPPANGIATAGTMIVDQTYENNGISGNGAAGAIGGNDPQVSDYAIAAGNIGDVNVLITVASANLPGVDFGFSYNVVTNTKSIGQGSLYQFTENARRIAGGNAGYFYLFTSDPNFSGSAFTISAPAGGLAAFDNASTAIYGGSQPGGYTIIVDGSSAGGVNGFDLTSSNNVVSNLTIQNFSLNGVRINNTSGNTVTANTITGNAEGVLITGASATSNTVSGNSISSSVNDGIQISNNASSNTISGNTISSNGDDGVDLNKGASNNTIQNNTISSNSASGIDISEGIIATSGNLISGNMILSNSADGITIVNAQVYSTTISNNTISNNSDTGIKIYNSSKNHTISGNMISSNTNDGIYIYFSANSISISNNDIKSNGSDGIELDGGTVTSILISKNTIWSNTGLGINLLNGANSSAGTVTITSVKEVSGTLTITGASSTGAAIEFFDVLNGGAAAADGSGAGEGPRFIISLVEGSGDDGDGAADGSFTFTVTGSGLSVGDVITATHILSGETSAFATNITIVAGP